MKRVPFVLAFALALCGLWGPAPAADEKQGDAPYVHTVIFYLKKDAPKDTAKAMIDDAFELLAKIPSVRGIKSGLPAAQSTPKFAVTDYQVGLVVLFDNYAGLDTYLKHPMHDKYVEKHMKYIEKALVYDFVDKTK